MEMWLLVTWTCSQAIMKWGNTVALRFLPCQQAKDYGCSPSHSSWSPHVPTHHFTKRRLRQWWNRIKSWVRPNSCNSQKKDFFIFWANVVLSVFLRAQNRVFRCFPSCKKSCSRSCFLVLSFVHKIVLFVVVPRAKNRAFWCSPSCQKPCSRSCFLVLPFVPKTVLDRALLRATNRAFWCFPSCKKTCSRSCFLVLSFVPKIVL